MIKRYTRGRAARLAAALLALTILLTGCAGAAQSPSAAPSSAGPDANADAVTPASPTPMPPAAMEGGSVSLTMRPAVTLNPLLNEDTSVDAALRLVFEPLAKIGDDFRPEPNIADFDFAADGMSAVVTLQSGLTWSDGTAVTSADVVYSLTVLKAAPPGAIYAADAKNIASWSTVSDRSVKVNFYARNSGQYYMFCFPVIPAAYYKNDAGADMAPLGDGMYQFDSYTVQKEMLLVRNDGYFGRRPYISTIHFILTPDADTGLDAFTQGVVDAIPADISDWGRFQGRFSGESINVDEYDTLNYDFIGLNFENPYVQSKDFREAVAMSVDVDSIVNNTYLGHAQAAAAPVNPDSWLFDAGALPYPFDLGQAKELLGAIDEVTTGGAISGPPASIRLLANQENDERTQIADQLAANLEKIGVAVDLQILPFDQYQTAIQSGDYDMFIGGYQLPASPDLSFMFASGGADGSGNIFRYRDPGMDALLEQAVSAPDDGGLKAAMDAVQEYAAAELPCIGLVFRKSALVSGQGVYGAKTPNCFDVFNGIENWFVKQ